MPGSFKLQFTWITSTLNCINYHMLSEMLLISEQQFSKPLASGMLMCYQNGSVWVCCCRCGPPHTTSCCPVSQLWASERCAGILPRAV